MILNTIKNYIIAVILIGSGWMASSQDDLRFKKLTKADGLSNNATFTITQDDKGFIWIGTRDGLNRYDGYRFKVYQFQDSDKTSLISNDIRSLYFDEHTASLWIGTRNGLSQYLTDEDKFYNYFEEEGFHITKVLRDSRSRLLIATRSGLFQIHDDRDIERLEIEGIPLNGVTELFEDSYQQLWISTENGLFVTKTNSLNEAKPASDLFSELSSLNDKSIVTICEGLNGNLWFGTENSGLYKWSISERNISSRFKNLDNNQSIDFNQIRDIVMDDHNLIWIGTSNGIYISDGSDSKLKHIFNDGSDYEGLSNNSIRSFHVDTKGGIWIGTYFRGVNYYDRTFDRFNIALPYKEGPDDDKNLISVITLDAEDNIWVGTEGRGISIWDNTNRKFRFVNIDKRLKDANIKSIYPDGSDVWIGTYKKGLARYSTVNRKLKLFLENENDPNSIPNNNIYDIKKYKDKIWLASFGSGLVMHQANDHFVTFAHNPKDPTTINSNDCRVLYVDHEDDFWVGTNNGLDKVIIESDERVSFERLLSQVTIYSITSFRPNEIWIGTFYKGLYKYDKKENEFTNYTVTDGLPGNTIYSILADGDDLWLSTNNGLAKLNAQSDEVTAFKHAGELKNLEFSQNASLNYRNRIFLFGSSNGLVYFQPSEIVQSSYEPNLVITDVSILDGKSKSSSKLKYAPTGKSNTIETIELENHKSTIEIKLSSLDFSNPDNIRYAFRMKGLEDAWRYNTGETKAIYAIQREGNYSFEAKATNSDGVWSANVLSLNLTVNPPWFRSWWAYVIYGGFILGIAYLLVRMVRLDNSYHLEHITKLEQEQSHELKIRFFTNITHEFRTPLTLMLGPLQDMIRSDNTGGALRTKLQGIYRNVQRLSNLVDQLLVFRKIETDHMKMRASEGHLVDFLKEIYLAFRDETSKRNIDYQFISKDRALKLWYDSEKLERVFFNLISNALKFTPDHGSISIVVDQSDEDVEIRVNDDGPGVDDAIKELIFERFYERSSTNYSNYGIGIGLSLSKQMVELHSGTLHIEDSVTGGASFVVKLPKGTSHFDPADLVPVDNLKGIQSLAIGPSSGDEHKEVKKRDTRLLIIEDDPDVCEYLKSLFENEYSLLIENNGKSGYERAKRELPDIILSDVMMPVMDGITMCSKLKTTLETSHIPVLLLTARSAIAYRIGGLETGADDYLTKPFNSEELILKIRNLVKTREIYLEKIVRLHSFEPEKIAVTSTDEKFLTKLVGLTESNIENSNLTIEQFADELNVSRALLFTKIKALTGQTPKGFVKSFRLKRAAQLLEDSDLNVSQVARKCGYRDYRYFTKVFKGQYEMTPKEFREDKESSLEDV